VWGKRGSSIGRPIGAGVDDKQNNKKRRTAVLLGKPRRAVLGTGLVPGERTKKNKKRLVLSKTKFLCVAPKSKKGRKAGMNTGRKTILIR